MPGAEAEAAVPVAIAAPHGPGSRLPVTVIAETATRRCEAAAEITVAEPGWTMWMVSHFHYDPVWWDTQGQYTESRLLLPGENGELPEVRTAFELVRLHLDAARSDPDYKFVLAEIDYLKPHFDAHPEDRADLLRLIAEGRIEIVGGNYNEPNTNLTCAESTIRNAIYGLGYQRDVIGGDIRAAWMLDAFGHDPGYPGLMAAAGLTDSAWGRSTSGAPCAPSATTSACNSPASSNGCPRTEPGCSPRICRTITGRAGRRITRPMSRRPSRRRWPSSSRSRRWRPPGTCSSRSAPTT
jgi:hypothetical protein